MAVSVYSLPSEVPAPVVDYRNFDYKKVEEDENAHKKRLAEHLVSMGYNGRNTGRVYSECVADGYAIYMIAESVSPNQAKFFLIHLPYGDAYQSRHVHKLTKKAILQAVESAEKITSMFTKANKAS